MDKPFISIIIPAYREEKSLPNTLKRFKEYLTEQNYSYEVLVVVDGAKDKTAEIAEEFSKDWPELKVINNKINHGKGYVVSQGMLSAKGEYRVFTDADNATDISHLEKMIPKFREGFEIVIGSRDYKDVVGAMQAIPQPWHKRQLGNLGNLFIQIVVLPGVWDTQAGFKGFSAEAAQKIFSKTTVERWGFDVEILALARKFGYKIAKIPLYWENNPDSRVKLSSYLGVLRDTIKVRWYLWRSKYEI